MNRSSRSGTNVSSSSGLSMFSLTGGAGAQDALNPSLKREILDLIEAIYFHDFKNDGETFNNYKDTSDYELNKQLEIESSVVEEKQPGDEKNCTMPFSKQAIKTRAKKLHIERDVVGRKVSDIILENSRAFSVELQRISEFKFLLDDTYEVCTQARRSLHMSEYSFLLPSLKLVKRHVKKQNLVKMLNMMVEIKRFNDSITQITDLTQNQEWPSAVNLAFKIEKEIQKYQNLNCVKGLKKKIREQLFQIEENLNENLSKLIMSPATNSSEQYFFDEILFGKMFTAYFKLDRVNQFFEKLSSSLLQSINYQFQQTIIYVIMSKKMSQSSDRQDMSSYMDQIKKTDTHELFKMIASEDYKRAIEDLSLNMWSIIKSYYRMSIWISNNYLTNENVSDKSVIGIIEKKLMLGLNLVWKEVQQRTSQLFRSMSFEHFKYDEFIQILTILNKLVACGNEFCSSGSVYTSPDLTSKILLAAVKDQTLAYFRAIHIMHLEELKMFLENEIWQWCPVESNFSIFNLHEYKFLKEASKFPLQPEINNQPRMVTDKQEIANMQYRFEINPRMVDLISSESTNPFECDSFGSESSSEGHSISSSTIDLNVSNKQDDGGSEQDQSTTSRKQDEEENAERLPIMTNTTLNIIRLFGKYVHMLSIFQIISNQVVDYMLQLYNFYFYFIYLDFAHEELEKMTSSQNNSESSQSSQGGAYTQLQSIIKTFKNDLFVSSKYNITEPFIQSIKAPSNRQDYIGCINQRIVAVESLIFLSNQLEGLFPLIERILPTNDYVTKKHIDYSKYLSEITTKIKSPIYMYIARYAIDYGQVLDSISKTNWDLSEIFSQHNAYVDMLLRQIKQFQHDIESLKEQGLLPPLSKRIVDSLLGETLKLVMKTLVDGYASVKKCSNEGRALMQLDFQQLVVKLEKMCSPELRPLPNKEFVESYIKAYYLPDSSIESWIKEHPEYNQKHINGLLSSMAQVTKKTRLNINSLLFLNGSNKENILIN